MAAAPRIKTTVVGSYPVPDWLLALPSEQALIDATRVVIHTQEQAGIDLVCDGEFSRFDVNHPETNGMIEYFVRPMAGMRTAITFDELVAYRAQRGMGFRTRPPAVVEGAVGAGTLDLPHACARGRRLASKPFKFTLTGPHMLAKSVIDKHYGSVPDLAMAIARCARRAGPASRRRCGADRRGQHSGQPRRMAMGGGRDQPRAGCGQDHARGASVLRQLRRAIDPEGRVGTSSSTISTRFTSIISSWKPRTGRRKNSPRSASCGRRSASASASSTSSRPSSNPPTQIARSIERAEDADRAGPGSLRPPGLRVLDAQARYRRWQDSRSGRGPQSL